MAQNVLKNRIINFEDLKCESQQIKDRHRQAFNSLIVNISQIDQYQQVDQFTHCEDCKMVLTNQDRDYIDDWNWVSSNEEHYKDIKAKVQIMSKNKWNYFIWNCRFCGNKNLISKDKVFFASNRTKVVIRQSKVNQEYQTSENPLLLFLIDNSSSMEEEIPELSDQNKIKANKQLNSMINDVKKGSIYQKIAENQKKNLSQIRKKIDPDAKNQPFTDFLSKYKVLMGITEKTVTQICEGKSKTESKLTVVQKPPPQRKIGFMFFSSDVILQKIPQKNETKVIKISDNQYDEQNGKVDFNNFNELFSFGKRNSKDYGMQISKFKFADIQQGNVSPSGQTALGPALVIATGIVSGYGPGSLIVIVTDGKANKGIFREDQIYQQQMKLLKFRLDKARASTCLMKLLESKNQQQNFDNQSTLQKYFRKYGSTIHVNLFQKDPLKQLQKRLITIIEQSISSKVWANQIKIKCQNPNIKYDKSLKKLTKKIFREKSIQTLEATVEQNKLTAFDYRHPFMTQILIYYQNIDTKQEAKFMAFTVQKLIKYGQMNKKDQESYGSVQTLQNVLSYLELQHEKLDLINMPLSICQMSFRQSISKSYKHSMQRQFKKKVMMNGPTEWANKQPPTKNPKDFINSIKQNKKQNQQQEDFDKL